MYLDDNISSFSLAGQELWQYTYVSVHCPCCHVV